MKTATIIFVALTVFSGLFLESSSAPSVLGNLRLDSLLGTALESIQGVLDTITKLLAGSKPEIKKTLEDPLKGLKELSIQLCDAIKNRDIDLIQKLLELIGVALENFNTVSAQLLEKYGHDANIKNLLDKVVKLVVDFVTKLVLKVKALLKERFDEIQNGLAPKLKKMVAGVLKDLDKAEASGNVLKIKESLCKLMENTDEINKVVLEAITTGNLDKLPSLIADFESNMAELKELCVHADLADGIKNKLTTVFELLNVILAECKGIKEIFEKVLKALAPIVKVLVNGLKNIVSKLKQDLADILKKFVEAIATAKGDVKELVIITKGLLKKLLDKLLDLIKNIEPLVDNGTDEYLNNVKAKSAIEKGIGKKFSLSGMILRVEDLIDIVKLLVD